MMWLRERKRRDEASDRIVGCVLAGGKSSRMGSDKSLLQFDGTPLVSRAVTTMREVFKDVVVISDKRDEYAFLDVPVLPDIKKECGPLGGIHAAFVHTGADSLFVLACDMPFVSSELIRYVVNAGSGAKAAVPKMNGRLQPLCGLYSRRSLPIIEQSLDSKSYRIQMVLAKLGPTVITIQQDLPFHASNLLDNLNTPDQINQALRSDETCRGAG